MLYSPNFRKKKVSEIGTVWEWDRFLERRNPNILISDVYCNACKYVIVNCQKEERVSIQNVVMKRGTSSETPPGCLIVLVAMLIMIVLWYSLFNTPHVTCQ